MLQKFDTTGLFKKHHKGFSWEKPQILFRSWVEYFLLLYFVP